MMLQQGAGSPIFSAETNPYKRATEEDGIDIFGRKIRKKDITKLLGELSKMGGKAGDEEDSELERLAPSPKGSEGKRPKYNPADIYGGFFSMYGGQRVKGGLLGD